MNTGQAIDFFDPCSWIPGSRAKPAPRNDNVSAFYSILLVLRPKQGIYFLVMAGLGPWAFSPRTRSVGIHVFAADCSARCECVDARHKAGHDELAGRCIIRMSQNTSGPIEPPRISNRA